MREDFLHYLWKYKKFAFAKAKTTNGLPMQLLNTGTHNQLAGPDFFNAQLEIDGQRWAGNVEIHLKSSDWYAHGHETDGAYDNVILHVVWEDDVAVFDRNGNVVPTLQLKDHVSQESLAGYHKLFTAADRRWINCGNDFGEVDGFLLENWLERVYLERLERKVKTVEALLKETENDWESVLFRMLLRNFGTKVNGPAFESLGRSLDFKSVRRCSEDPSRLEALFLGLGNILDRSSEVPYERELISEYDHLKKKYALDSEAVLPVQYFKLRPPNFPTIRLSQLAQLYHGNPVLFQEVIAASSLDVLRKFLKIGVSPFWETHFTFSKQHSQRTKTLSKAFVDLLLINTVLPLHFAYGKLRMKQRPEQVLEWARQISGEKNGIVKEFNKLRHLPDDAMTSQALLQLKAEYCDKNRCLQCAVGSSLLSG